MSVSIHVQINRPLSLRDIAEGSANALRELLNLKYPAPIEAAFEEVRVRSNVSENDSLAADAPLVICSIP